MIFPGRLELSKGLPIFEALERKQGIIYTLSTSVTSITCSNYGGALELYQKIWPWSNPLEINPELLESGNIGFVHRHQGNYYLARSLSEEPGAASALVGKGRRRQQS